MKTKKIKMYLWRFDHGTEKRPKERKKILEKARNETKTRKKKK
jgi:hypothetical protein